MEPCATCGNHYDNAFQVNKAGKTYTFDSFECAISKLAPTCKHCGQKIIGHGVQAGSEFYCCAHCARHEGNQGITDRVSA